MGMPKGSRWKRLAVFNDDINSDIAPALCAQLRMHRIEIEWWQRTVKETKNKESRTGCRTIGREWHPKNEAWLMVRRGDWPFAYALAKDYGVTL